MHIFRRNAREAAPVARCGNRSPLSWRKWQKRHEARSTKQLAGGSRTARQRDLLRVCCCYCCTDGNPEESWNSPQFIKLLSIIKSCCPPHRHTDTHTPTHPHTDRLFTGSYFIAQTDCNLFFLLFFLFQTTCSHCARTTFCSSSIAKSMEPSSGHRTSATWTVSSPSRRTRSCSALCCASTCCSWTAMTICLSTMEHTQCRRPRYEHRAASVWKYYSGFLLGLLDM